ncbi:hypothetical protein ACIBI4_22200 [Streptomyces sp. NPDC050418]|uniref:hypothetical protein n=1 Tax=Streptomyces sp. NPDC050418 TaxID=3365612 RepID=UPI0037A3972E
MSDLTPTHEFPGIRIGLHAPDDEPFADYVCGGCGATNQATGTENVTALVRHWELNHGPAHAQVVAR